MRILIAISILIIIFGFFPCEAGQIAAPSMPLKLPDNVSWINTVLGTKKDGTRDYQRHAFIARGAKWRSETEMFNKPTVIIVFDGKSMGSNIDFQKSKISEGNSPQFWDARTNIQMIYASFDRSHYKGVEKIDNNNCWHFSDEEEGIKFQLWVDVAKKIPRRIYVSGPGQDATREIYDDLPQPINIIPELFDPKNLKVILLAK
jgi:hypothetical protein